MHGIRGKEYPINLYQVPKLKIDKMAFIHPTVQEENVEFEKDAVFLREGSTHSPQEPGRLGWELFYHSNLLIDVKNSQIAFCDGLNTLTKQGYPVQDFIFAHLLLERGLVEFEAETPDGILRCTLDTGATWNMLNTEIDEGKPLEQVMWEPNRVREYPFFKASGKELGPLSFHTVPIKLPIHIEAILGMEFFRDHLVFLDFEKKQLYFYKYPVQ